MNHLAQLGPPEDWMPFVIGVILFMIPIVAILTKHQQRMAQILRENAAQGAPNPEVDALRADVARLTQAVHQNTIAIDSLIQKQSLPPGPMLASEEPPSFLQGR